VTLAGTGAVGDTVIPVELPAGRVLKPIKVGGGPQGIAITPSGRFAYVADAGAIVTGQTGPLGTTVTPIDLTTRRALAPITVGNGPVAVAIAPGGAAAYVANLDSESVSPINLSTNRAGAPIAVDGGPLALAIVASGGGGSAGSTAYVVNGPAGSGAGRLGNNVTPIRLSTGVAGRPIRVPRGPQEIAVTPDGTTAWVTSLDADLLTPINLATDRRGPAIRVLGGPFAIAITERSPTAHSGTSTTTRSGHG
jgi:YVTN family beta-propeller protein